MEPKVSYTVVLFRIFRRCKINDSSRSLPLSSVKLLFQSGLWALESIPMSALLLWKRGWLNKGVNNCGQWEMVGLQYAEKKLYATASERQLNACQTIG